MCAINYENEAKSDDYLGRRAVKNVVSAISVPFSGHRPLIGPRVCVYALINPEYT